MNRMGFIIFLSVVLAIHTSVNYYIFIRGLQALPNVQWLRSTYYIAFGFLFLSYIAAAILVRINPTPLSTALNLAGSVWMGAMLYLFLFILLWDILRLANHFLPFFPAFITVDYQKGKMIVAGFTVIAVAAVLISGYINAAHPRLKKMELEIGKQTNGLEEMNVVVVSDIHIGVLIGRKQVERLVQRINSLTPDLVLFPGDILDEDLAPVLKDKSGESLKNIKAKFGVYAVTGNHEYIGGIAKAVPYIESLGIKLLRDTSVLINGMFWLAGREDRDISRFNGHRRKTLEEVLSGVDKSLPVILMDHQPFHLEEAELNGVDLQLSGHTHHGQLWPFNFITKKVYELSWGYTKRGKTQYYVSCGYGTWGPPIRTGNTPEMMLFNIKFSKGRS